MGNHITSELCVEEREARKHAALQTVIDVEDWNAFYEEWDEKVSKRRAAPRNRNRGYALEEMDALTDPEFKAMFRLSRQAFYFLLPQLNLQSKNPIHRGRDISPKTKLAVTLRFLAGGSYLDICFAFGIGRGTFFKDDGILWGTIDAIDHRLEIGFPLNDQEKLNEISEGFSEYCHGRVKGCVMAMDGWVCGTRCPTEKEVGRNITCYRNRTGIWGLVVFAGCDHLCRFMMLSSICPGATNDCMAWQLSAIRREVIDKNRLPPNYFFICDEALECTESVLTPFSGTGLGPWMDSFNYHLSSMRQCIERAFGLLVRRFGIFWRKLEVHASRWTSIVQVCGKLHNLCIDFNGGLPEMEKFDIETIPEDEENDNDVDEYLRNEYFLENSGIRGANARSQRRITITNMLSTMGYRRPHHSKHSKA